MILVVTDDYYRVLTNLCLDLDKQLQGIYKPLLDKKMFSPTHSFGQNQGPEYSKNDGMTQAHM